MSEQSARPDYQQIHLLITLRAYSANSIAPLLVSYALRSCLFVFLLAALLSSCLCASSVAPPFQVQRQSSHVSFVNEGIVISMSINLNFNYYRNSNPQF